MTPSGRRLTTTATYRYRLILAAAMQLFNTKASKASHTAPYTHTLSTFELERHSSTLIVEVIRVHSLQPYLGLRTPAHRMGIVGLIDASGWEDPRII